MNTHILIAQSHALFLRLRRTLIRSTWDINDPQIFRLRALIQKAEERYERRLALLPPPPPKPPFQPRRLEIIRVPDYQLPSVEEVLHFLMRYYKRERLQNEPGRPMRLAQSRLDDLRHFGTSCISRHESVLGRAVSFDCRLLDLEDAPRLLEVA